VSLIDLRVRQNTSPLPASVRALIDESRRRVDAFIEAHLDPPLPSFVSSDFEVAYRCLLPVFDSGAAPGRRFCEWGCGMGVVASLASIVGFQSCGIEIVPGLAAEASRLARDFGLEVDIACGTFVPKEAEAIQNLAEQFAWIESGGADGYELLALSPRSFHAVYAYPWPGEEYVIESLFDECCADGALLISFHGSDGIRVRRRVMVRKSRRRPQSA